MPKRVAPEPRRRLVLQADNKVIFICDEYYPKDYGRVHLLTESRYGQFDRDNMTLEYAKCAVNIVAVLYDDLEWPADFQSAEEIETYFRGRLHE